MPQISAYCEKTMFVLEKSIIPLPRKIENKNSTAELAKIDCGKFTVVNGSDDMLCVEAEKWICDNFYKIYDWMNSLWHLLTKMQNKLMKPFSKSSQAWLIS